MAQDDDPIRLGGYLHAELRLERIRFGMAEHFDRAMDGFKEVAREELERVLSATNVGAEIRKTADGEIKAAIREAVKATVESGPIAFQITSEIDRWAKSDALRQQVSDAITSLAQREISAIAQRALWEDPAMAEKIAIAVKGVIRSGGVA